MARNGHQHQPGEVSSKRAIEHRQHQQQALELRMMGLTWDDIMVQVKKPGPDNKLVPVWKDSTGAYRAVMALLQRNESPKAEEYRRFRSAQLTRLLRAHWPAAVGAGAPGTQPDIKAAELCRKLIADMRQLWGTDAPVKVEASGPDGAPLQINVGVKLEFPNEASRTDTILKALIEAGVTQALQAEADTTTVSADFEVLPGSNGAHAENTPPE